MQCDHVKSRAKNCIRNLPPIEISIDAPAYVVATDGVAEATDACTREVMKDLNESTPAHIAAIATAKGQRAVVPPAPTQQPDQAGLSAGAATDR
jgi:hypothetical protein